MAASNMQLHVVRHQNSGPVDGDSTVTPSAGESERYVERLYRKYRASLSHYVAGMLPGGQQDAEVIIQETYIRLLRQSSLEHLQVNARAYIFTIATNLVRDLLRKQVRCCGDAHDPLQEEEHCSKDDSPPHNAQWQQSLQRLQVALQELRPVCRQVFVLSRFEEMTYPEIANRLSISTRSVERHMSAALKHLQKTLEDLI